MADRPNHGKEKKGQAVLNRKDRRRLEKVRRRARNPKKKRRERQPEHIRDMEDPREQRVQEVKHQISEIIRYSPVEDDGVLAACFGLGSSHVADQIVAQPEIYGVDPTKRDQLAHWIDRRWRSCDLDLEGFEEWDHDMTRRMEEANV